MKNTLIVNLFGGPGTGKSTGAAYIFSKLKLHNIDAELVTEFAKDKVWEQNEEVFKCQLYLSGKQLYRISRCYGKVDVIVTDSPILLGTIYNNENPYLESALKYEFDKYNTNSLNVFLSRVKKYNSNGRLQTEKEADEISSKIYNKIIDSKIPYCIQFGDIEGYDNIVDEILRRFGINIKNDNNNTQ